MLVLSRHIDEKIYIGDDIVITLCDIRGDKARIGVDCPKHIRVDRQEVREAINRESAEAERERKYQAKRNQSEQAGGGK